MKYSLILDRMGKCSGCQFEVPGPSKILNTQSMCTWCERNPLLISVLTDQYKKLEKVSMDLTVIPGVEDDTSPAENINKDFLKGWGINPEVKKKKRRKKE